MNDLLNEPTLKQVVLPATIIDIVQATYLLGPTTNIYEFVCPPNISETVAVRIVKLAHRPRIASTTITRISKPFYCPFDKFY